MLIDDFLPDHDLLERHQIIVHASIEQVYAAVQRLELGQAKLSMLLFRLRGLTAGRPAPSSFTLADLLQRRFILLGEKPNEELLLGLVGRFWTPAGGLRRLAATDYRNFNEPGFAKAAWNFSLTERPDNTILLATETRVYCLDEVSRRRFRFYWRLIGPFSGLIRREILQALKRQAESAPLTAGLTSRSSGQRR